MTQPNAPVETDGLASTSPIDCAALAAHDRWLRTVIYARAASRKPSKRCSKRVRWQRFAKKRRWQMQARLRRGFTGWP